MKKIILFLFALIMFTFLSSSVNAQWWNSSWHYRLPVVINSSSSVTNATVNVTVNFTSYLAQVGDGSYTFDPNSIRVVETNEDIPHDFYNISRDTGNVSFIANGTTPSNTNRIFYIYFDVLENGAKPIGKIITENASWKSGYNSSVMNVWSNQSSPPGIGYEWNRSWAKSMEVSWKWCTEKDYDFAYLYVDGIPTRIKDGIGGSETILLQGSRLVSRFTSVVGKPPSCTDYGSYVERIKFFPTTNYTTPPLNITKGDVSTQYPPVLGNASVSPSLGGWGEPFNYSIDVYDRENDSVNVTLWILGDSGWIKNETKTINPPGRLSWYISPFSCSDIGLRNYMFEYRDSYHEWNNTTSQTGPTLDKDDIDLEYFIGNDGIVNRDGDSEITLGVKFKDIDNNQYVSGESVNFWVFYSGVFNSIGLNTSEENGNAIINFNPNCYVEVGSHYWKANYSSSACYKSKQSSLFNFTTLGQIKNYLIYPPHGSTYNRNDMIPLEANLTDDCNNYLTGASVNFSLNDTYNCPATDRGTGAYNCTWDSTAKPLGYYSVRVNSSLANYNFNSSIWLSRFYLDTAPPTIIINISRSQIEQSGAVEINATVIDIEGIGIQWVKINVTKPDGTLDQNNMTNIASNIWAISYPGDWGNTTQRGIYNVTVYALDNNAKIGSSNTILKVYAKLNITLRTFQSQYYQGKHGSLYCIVRDLTQNLTGVRINLTIRDSSDNEVYLLTGKNYETDSTGKISAVFILPADATVGNYTVIANLSYNDTNATVFLTNFTTYNFEVLKEEFLSAKLIIPVVQYINQQLSISLLVYRYQTQMIDPDEIDITVYYSTSQFGLVKWFNITKNEMNRTSTGFYTYSRLIPADTTSGNYIAVLNATKDSIQIADITAFEILVGGPFDVSIKALKSEVAPGETLPFEINITNKGDTDRFDVNVSYWIQNGTRYFEETAVNIPAHSFVTLQKSFTIYSDEPEGIYTLNAKVVYDPTFSPATAKTTFRVRTPSAPVPSPGVVEAPPIPVTIPRLNIVSYPDEVEIERGWIGYANIEVKNNGTATLHNIYLNVTGISPEWVQISPERIESLTPNSTGKFSIKIAIPIIAKSGNYPVTIKAVSNETSDEKTFIVRIFASKAELIQYQLQTLEEKLIDLENRTADAETRGLNVTIAKGFLREARDKIGTAENYLASKLYDEASVVIRNIKDLLAKAEYELKVAQPIKPSPIAFIQILKYWFYLIVAFLIAIIVLIIYLIKRTKPYIKFKKVTLPELRKAILGKHILSELEKEKSKLEKMLKLIENEYKEGIISKESYEELKKIIEEKLNDIELKLGEK